MSEPSTADAATEVNGDRTGAAQAAPLRTRSPLHHAQAVFAAFDAKDIDALAALMTEDVRLQIGNADVVNGKAQFVDALEADYRVYMDITPVYAQR